MGINDESASLIRALATNLEKWKRGNQISQRKLAKTIQIADSTLRSILGESQNIEIKTLVKIALAFSLDMQELFRNSETIPQLVESPVPQQMINKAVTEEQIRIGKNITRIMNQKKISPEVLSILACNTDYSDTIKYLKGQINLTLITISKFADALEVEVWELL